MRRKTFICYRFHEDSHYKDLLLDWSEHCAIDFTYSDTSIESPIDSTNADQIKQSIRPKIESSPYFLCIVGKNTYKSSWVQWEIDTAVKLKRKMIAVKTDVENRAPEGLNHIDLKWAALFTYDSIIKAIEEA